MGFDLGSMIGGAASTFVLNERTRDVNARTAADQRQAEEREAEKSRGFSAEQAQVARDWSERMSSSAHQREIADLQKAGLNPILSGTGGMGAASGGGVAASSAKAAAALGAPSPDYGKVFSSALDARRNKAEVRNMEEMLTVLTAQEVDLRQSAALKSAQHNQAQAGAKLANQQAETEAHNTATARQDAAIRQNQRQGSDLEGEIDNTTYGKVMRYIDRAMQSLRGTSGALRSLPPGDRTTIHRRGPPIIRK